MTGDEIKAMEALNPKSPQELAEEQENERFLNEQAEQPTTTAGKGAKRPATKRPKHP
jgi:hypothetical protein